jgi:hypothetical protein
MCASLRTFAKHARLWLQVYDLRAASGSGPVEPLFTFLQTVDPPKAVLTVTWNPLRPVRIGVAVLS